MPDLKHLRALCEVASHGSFSAAADALNYTQPAVSRLVASLERELGATLIDRGARPLRLTDAGHALARRAGIVFEQLAVAGTEIDAILELNAGTLRVGAFSAAGATLLADAVAAFQSRRPGIELSIVEARRDALLTALRAGELDLAIVFDWPNASGLGEDLELVHLLDEPHDLVLHPQHPLARRRKLSFEDIAAETWLFPALGPDHPAQRLLEQACAKAGIEPNIAFRINDCPMAESLVAIGMGISILPRLALHPAHPGVVIRELNDAPIRRIWAARISSRHRPAAADEFVGLLQTAAAPYHERPATQRPSTR